jgi:hypothetical protein
LTLRNEILPALNLQVGEAASSWASTARRSRKSSEVWLGQQAAYDLWQVRQAA